MSYPYRLQVYTNQLVGIWGKELTIPILQKLARRIANFTIEAGIDTVVVGSDLTELGSNILEALSDQLVASNVKVVNIAESCCTFQVGWMCLQLKEKPLGFYIGTSGSWVQICAYNRNGDPFTDKEISDLLKHSAVIESQGVLQQDNLEGVSLDKYPKYLQEVHGVNLQTIGPIGVDLMFGGSESIFKEDYERAHHPIKVFNRPSSPIRVHKYVGIPSGRYLQWKAPYLTNQGSKALFAVSTDGSRLGVYDVIQDLEISPSGVTMLILDTLQEEGKLTSDSTIVLSKGLSKKVFKLTKKLKINVQVQNDLSEDPRNLSKILFAANELGQYYFSEMKDYNPIYAIYLIAKLLKEKNKSPGELLDEYTLKYLKKTYYYRTVALSKVKFKRKQLVKEVMHELNSSVPRAGEIKLVNSCKYSSYLYSKTKELSIRVSNNMLDNTLDIFVESLNQEVTDLTISEILKLIYHNS